MKNTSGILQDISDFILDGGRRTTAKNTRTILNEMAVSYPNFSDGGNLFEKEAGYAGAFRSTSPNAFATVDMIPDVVDLSAYLRLDGTSDATTGVIVIGSGQGFRSGSNSIYTMADNFQSQSVVDGINNSTVTNQNSYSWSVTSQDTSVSEISQINAYASNTGGVGFRTSAYYSYQRTDNLTSDHIVQWQDKDYTGVADLSDIAAIADLYIKLDGSSNPTTGYIKIGDGYGFVSDSSINNNIYFQGNETIIEATDSVRFISGNSLYNFGSAFVGTLDFTGLTASRNIPFQDIDYTGVADLTDVAAIADDCIKIDGSSYATTAPIKLGVNKGVTFYTGTIAGTEYLRSTLTGNGNANTGNYIAMSTRDDSSTNIATLNLQATGVATLSVLGPNGTIVTRATNTVNIISDSDYVNINASNANGYGSNLSSELIRSNVIHKFPDKDGTFAMISDIPSVSGVYLPLAGAVSMTGQYNLSADASTALQPTTLQQVVAMFNGYEQLQTSYDASGNTFPTASNTSPVVASIKKGMSWYVSVAGTLGGTAVSQGDEIISLVDSPGQTSTNWLLISHTIGYMPLANTLSSAKIFVGNASNIATGVNLTLSTTPGAFGLSNAGVLTITNADTVTRGLLTASDWNTFNNKQVALVSGTNIKTLYGATLLGSGDAGIAPPTYGGTGVNNGSNTLTLSGNLTTTGAFNPTFAIPRSTTWTLPNTAGETLAGLGTINAFSVQQNFSSAGLFVFDTTAASYKLALGSSTTTRLNVGTGFARVDLPPTTVVGGNTQITSSSIGSITNMFSVLAGSILNLTAASNLGNMNLFSTANTSFGSGQGVVYTGLATTAPTSNVSSGFMSWAADDGSGSNVVPNFRTSGGNIIKLYQPNSASAFTYTGSPAGARSMTYGLQTLGNIYSIVYQLLQDLKATGLINA